MAIKEDGDVIANGKDRRRRCLSVYVEADRVFVRLRTWTAFSPVRPVQNVLYRVGSFATLFACTVQTGWLCIHKML